MQKLFGGTLASLSVVTIANDYDNMKGYGLNLRHSVYYVRDIKAQRESRNISTCCT